MPSTLSITTFPLRPVSDDLIRVIGAEGAKVFF